MERPEIIGVSHDIKRIRDLIKHVAANQMNVLITGETGVGKEVVAQNLHSYSFRAAKPFVKVNCAALPEGLLESELYGHERGAFTGAEKKKEGKFELADQGVLFLDEIGDMHLSLQSKLLHALQSGEYSPLGSEKNVKTDTWVIAATNHDIVQAIAQKAFREDLYYRLSVIQIYIPPLRNRPDDVHCLLRHFLESYRSRFRAPSHAEPSPAELDKLLSYHWPGNVRELQNVVRRFLLSGDWDYVIGELLAGDAACKSFSSKPAPQAFSMSELITLNKGKWQEMDSISLKKIKKEASNRVEKEVIDYVLKKTSWNRMKASKILKISYKTLLYKIEELSLAHPSSGNIV
jgi:two-component system, NtrC family, response regulator AtoC